MTTTVVQVHQSMKSHRAFHGAVDTRHLGKLDLPTLSPSNKHLKDDFTIKMEFMDGCFHFLVDSGCACSCSPFKEDFVNLTGDVICHCGGMICVEMFNSKGHISVLETPGHSNPEQSV